MNLAWWLTEKLFEFTFLLLAVFLALTMIAHVVFFVVVMITGEPIGGGSW